MRLVCATNRVLAREVESGNFRRDLYYRVNVVRISLAPLRERASDIATIADYFVESYNARYGCRAPSLSDECLYQMRLYGWPGNIRQLENIMRRYVLMQSEDVVLSELSQPTAAGLPIDIPRDESTSLKRVARKTAGEVERKIILAALEASGWNRKRTARVLSISYRALLYKLRALGVPPGRQHQATTLRAVADHKD
jgi:two-component system response regulator AtoC